MNTANFFIASFFISDCFGNPFTDTFTDGNDLFSIMAAYQLSALPDTDSLKIVNGFLSDEDAYAIYDYDR